MKRIAVILLLVVAVLGSAGCRSKVDGLTDSIVFGGKEYPGGADPASPDVIYDESSYFHITSVEIAPIGSAGGSSGSNYLIAGEEATISVNWAGGTSPYYLEVFLSDQDEQPMLVEVSNTSYTRNFILPDCGRYCWSVNLYQTGYGVKESSGEYVVRPVPGTTTPPVIGSVEYDPTRGLMTVTVTDQDQDDRLSVAVTEPEGFMVDQPRRDLKSRRGKAEFLWYPRDPAASPTGMTTVTVCSEWEPDQPVSATRALSFDLSRDPLLMLSAVPLQTAARVGDTVTVVVSTGHFPARAPFAYMNGVGVTVEEGGEYVDGTFNVGSPGGDTEDIDGIWAKLDPAPVDFFVPEDFMMKAAQVEGDDSLVYFGFNVTPIQAGQTTSGGDLFNFGIRFAEPGIYHLGFLEHQDVKRTYYSTSAAEEHYWNDLDNYTGIPNHIIVTE